jgi:hypothetical protein
MSGLNVLRTPMTYVFLFLTVTVPFVTGALAVFAHQARVTVFRNTKMLWTCLKTSVSISLLTLNLIQQNTFLIDLLIDWSINQLLFILKNSYEWNTQKTRLYEGQCWGRDDILQNMFSKKGLHGIFLHMWEPEINAHMVFS